MNNICLRSVFFDNQTLEALMASVAPGTLSVGHQAMENWLFRSLKGPPPPISGLSNHQSGKKLKIDIWRESQI